MNASVLGEAVTEIQELPFIQRPMSLVQDTEANVQRWQARTVAKVRSHLVREKRGEKRH